MRVAVAGIGYVGTANALLLAQRHDVTLVDVVAERVAAVNARRSPVADPLASAWLAERASTLRATLAPRDAYEGADVVIVATPTDVDPASGSVDVSSVDEVLGDVARWCPGATVILKSTVPVGFTDAARQRPGCEGLVFSPEFLREGHALHDVLHPSRVVVGDRSARGERVARLFVEGCARPDVPVLFTGAAEAEAIKLFANTFLAMRIAFFNELDTHAASHGLDAQAVIRGVCLDPRIGDHYNNPSFGYGGYCLPKDARQLLAAYGDVPQDLVRAVVDANATRMRFVADEVLRRGARVIGVYRLGAKSGSDSLRSSAVVGVLEHLRAAGAELVVYEPSLDAPAFRGVPVERDLARFKARADLILANRSSPALADVADRVFTRDLFGRD